MKQWVAVSLNVLSPNSMISYGLNRLFLQLGIRQSMQSDERIGNMDSRHQVCAPDSLLIESF
jgi:hypothetical protein